MTSRLPGAVRRGGGLDPPDPYSPSRPRCRARERPTALSARGFFAPTRFAVVAPRAYIAGRAMTIDQIISDFALLDDWEERYRYIIDLGRQLTPLPDAERTEQNRVRGCASQVWLSTHRVTSAGTAHLHFIGD